MKMHDSSLDHANPVILLALTGTIAILLTRCSSHVVIT